MSTDIGGNGRACEISLSLLRRKCKLLIEQQLGLQLHDRATRGLALSEAETRQLEQWYAEQDALEMQELDLESLPTLTTSILAQIETTLQQIATLTQQIQQMIVENQQLKERNEQLSVQMMLG